MKEESVGAARGCHVPEKDEQARCEVCGRADCDVMRGDWDYRDALEHWIRGYERLLMVNVGMDSLREAVRDLLETMEMQEKREAGEAHIKAPVALYMWNAAKEKARFALSRFGPPAAPSSCPNCKAAEAARAKLSGALRRAMSAMPGHGTSQCHPGCWWIEANAALASNASAAQPPPKT